MKKNYIKKTEKWNALREELHSAGCRLKTALLAEPQSIYNDTAVQIFLESFDCLFPYRSGYPTLHTELCDIYVRIAHALGLAPSLPDSYIGVYYAFGENAGKHEKLRLSLPIYRDENEYVVYAPFEDTYQYGFYHYGNLYGERPLAVCPDGYLLVCLETQKKRRPRMILAGDAFAPFLVPYLAHHFDLAVHAPISSRALFAKELANFGAEEILITGGASLFCNDLFFDKLY